MGNRVTNQAGGNTPATTNTKSTMNITDFLKLANAIKILTPYLGNDEKIDEALQLLREIFNNNGGADRYLLWTEP